MKHFLNVSDLFFMYPPGEKPAESFREGFGPYLFIYLFFLNMENDWLDKLFLTSQAENSDYADYI